MLASCRIVLKIFKGVIKRDAGSAHELIHFGTGRESEHPPRLRPAEHTSLVALNCEGFQSMAWDISPLLLEQFLNVLGEINMDCHLVLRSGERVRSFARANLPLT